MSKIKSSGNGLHPPRHKQTSSAKHSHQSNLSSMDKVKIKRVNRNKKKVTTKEKILAGLGVGGSLLGGIAGLSSKPGTEKRIVSTTGNDQQSNSSKIKSSISNVFKNLADNTIGIAQAKADYTNPVEGDTADGGQIGLSAGVQYTFYQGNWVVNNGQTVDGSTIGQEAGFNYGSNGGGWILLDGQTKTDSSGVTYISSGGQWAIQQAGQQGSQIGDTKTGDDGFQYVFSSAVYSGGAWTLADGQTRQQGGDNWHTSAGSWVDDGPITPAASNAPKEGDTKTENGINYTFYQGNWVVNNGQTVDGSTIGQEAGFNYGSNGGGWILLDGQTKTDSSGVNYISSAGQWVVASTGTAAPKEGDTQTGSDGFKYVFTNQRWTLADGQTRQQGGDNWHTSAGSWVDDGPITPAASNAPKEGDTRLFTSAQGDSYHQKYTSGLWVLSPQEGDVMVDARATGNVMSTYTNGQWVTKTVTPNEGDTKTGPDGFNYTYYNGNWVLNNGQNKIGSDGFNYSSGGGNWILLDGQTKIDSKGVVYVSAGGQWVVQTASGTVKTGAQLNSQYGITSFDPSSNYILGSDGKWTLTTTSTAPKEGDKGTTQIGTATVTATYKSGNWVVDDGQTVDGSNVSGFAGFNYISSHSTTGTLNWTLKDGQHATGSQIGKAAGSTYTSKGGVFVMDSAGSLTIANTNGPTTASMYNTGSEFQVAIATQGGTGPYTWQAVPDSGSHALPSGLINSTSNITGGSFYSLLTFNPTDYGQYSFTMLVTDANGQTTSQHYDITINKVTASNSTLTLEYINFTPYDPSFDAQLKDPTFHASIVAALPSYRTGGVVPGTCLAAVLGLGDGTSGTTPYKDANGNTYPSIVGTDGVTYELVGNVFKAVATTSTTPTDTDISNMIAAATAGRLTADQLSLFTTYFGSGQNANKIPSTFAPNSEFSFALGLGDGSTATQVKAQGNGVTYYFYGGAWHNTTASTTTPSAQDIANMLADAATMSYSQMSSAEQTIFNNYFSSGQNQSSIPSSFGVNSAFADALGLGNSAGAASNQYKKQGSNKAWYIIVNGAWTPTSAPTGDLTGLTAANVNSVIYDGTSEMNAQISQLNLTQAQIASFQSSGIVPGTALAYMFGLGNGTSQTTTTVSSGTYTFSGGVWKLTSAGTGTTTTSSSVTLSDTVGKAFSAQLSLPTGSNITSPTYSLSGSMPKGLSLSSNGTISGTPTATGTQSFVVTVTDAKSSSTATINVTFVVSAVGATVTPTVSSNITSPKVGDTWSITVTGNPGDAVSVTTSSPTPSTSSMGTIPASGSLTFTGKFSTADLLKDSSGNYKNTAWNETWTVGGKTAGTVTFTLSATTTGSTLSGGDYYLDPSSLYETGPAANGQTGQSISYLNPTYYANEATADALAAMLGGKAVNVPIFVTPGNPFNYSPAAQNQWFIQMPDGSMLNAGAIASIYTHGYSDKDVASYVQQQVALASTDYQASTASKTPTGLSISWAYVPNYGYVGTDTAGNKWVVNFGALIPYTGTAITPYANPSSTAKVVSSISATPKVGDTWSVTVTGAPGATVSVHTNSPTSSTTSLGTLSGSGITYNSDGTVSKTFTGVFSNSDLQKNSSGSYVATAWSEDWSVNGAVVKNISFTISPNTTGAPAVGGSAGGTEIGQNMAAKIGIVTSAPYQLTSGNYVSYQFSVVTLNDDGSVKGPSNLTYTWTAVDSTTPNGPTRWRSLKALPDGMSFNSSGVLSGTPTYIPGGINNYDFNVIATDPNGVVVSATDFTITVLPVATTTTGTTIPDNFNPPALHYTDGVSYQPAVFSFTNLKGGPGFVVGDQWKVDLQYLPNQVPVYVMTQHLTDANGKALNAAPTISYLGIGMTNLQAVGQPFTTDDTGTWKITYMVGAYSQTVGVYTQYNMNTIDYSSLKTIGSPITINVLAQADSPTQETASGYAARYGATLVTYTNGKYGLQFSDGAVMPLEAISQWTSGNVYDDATIKTFIGKYQAAAEKTFSYTTALDGSTITWKFDPSLKFTTAEGGWGSYIGTDTKGHQWVVAVGFDNSNSNSSAYGTLLAIHGNTVVDPAGAWDYGADGFSGTGLLKIPKLASISQTSITPGTDVTITGDNIYTDSGGLYRVEFMDSTGKIVQTQDYRGYSTTDGSSTNITNITKGSISFTMPTLPAGNYKVVLVTAEGTKSQTSNGLAITVQQGNGTYGVTQAITVVSTSEGDSNITVQDGWNANPFGQNVGENWNVQVGDTINVNITNAQPNSPVVINMINPDVIGFSGSSNTWVPVTLGMTDANGNFSYKTPKINMPSSADSGNPNSFSFSLSVGTRYVGTWGVKISPKTTTPKGDLASSFTATGTSSNASLASAKYDSTSGIITLTGKGFGTVSSKMNFVQIVSPSGAISYYPMVTQADGQVTALVGSLPTGNYTVRLIVNNYNYTSYIFVTHLNEYTNALTFKTDGTTATSGSTGDSSTGTTVISTTTLPDATVGVAYSQTLAVSNLDTTQSWTWSATGLPSGLTINSSTGVISGTPTVATTATGNVTVKLTSSGGTILTQVLTLSVRSASSSTSAPTITSITPASGTQGQSATITVVGQNLSGASLTANSGSGLTISNVQISSDGTQLVATVDISSTAPTGTDTLTLTTTNGSANTGFKVLSGTVVVSITTSSLPNATVGTAYSQAVSATNLASSAVWSASGLPDGLTVNSSTGIISGTPTTATSSSGATVTVSVLSAGQSIVKTFTLVVNAASTNTSAPTITSITPASGTQGQSATITVVGQNLSGASLTANSGSGLTISNVQVNSAGTQLTATVAVSSSAPTGADTLTLTTTSGSVTSGFTVVASSSTYSLSLGQTNLSMLVGQSASVLATVTTPSGTSSPLVSASSSNTAVATVSVDTTTGLLTIVSVGTGTATVTVHPTGMGTDTTQDKTITVTVTSSSSGTGTGSGSGAVSGVTPFFTTASYLASATVGQNYNGYITATANYSMTFKVIAGSLPPGMVLNSDGSFNGVPTAAGTYNFTVMATTSQSVTSSQQFTINVLSSSGTVQTYSYGGSSYVSGSSQVAGAQTFQGLQMPSGYSASTGSTGGLQMQYGNDLSATYANVNGTIYDKTTGHGFATPAEFFTAAGVNSFDGLIFDTNWQPGTQVAGVATSTTGTYTVKKGDTLFSIAQKVYGKGQGKQWRKILSANPNSLKVPGNTKSLKVGAVLNIPSL